MKGYFITGTDTGVGKTTIAGKILHSLSEKGYKTAGLKPVASGCVTTPEGLVSLDAIHLQTYATVDLPYQTINPFAYAGELAPNIAAKKAGEVLSVAKVFFACAPLLSTKLDWVVIEGCGGWRVPLNNHETMADLAIAFGFPIILVVKIQLGCINHALLTYESLINSNVKIKGWVANICTPVALGFQWIADENVRIIQEFLTIPFLGTIPYNGAGNVEITYE